MIDGFIEEYFIAPMVERSGYNVVNTTVYIGIALIILYFIYKAFKKHNVKLDNYFFLSLTSFIAFGASKRVVTDATDKIFFGELINSLYEYNFFNISPFIYIFTASLFLISLAIEYKFKIKNLTLAIGSFLTVLHLIILVPHFQNLTALIGIAFLSALVFGATFLYFKKYLPALLTLAHSIDGASTFIAIEFFGYGEQHVLASFIGENFGYFAFFLTKAIVAFIFAYFVEKEKMNEFDKKFLYAIAITAGLSPGLRSALRLVVGV